MSETFKNHKLSLVFCMLFYYVITEWTIRRLGPLAGFSYVWDKNILFVQSSKNVGKTVHGLDIRRIWSSSPWVDFFLFVLLICWGEEELVRLLDWRKHRNVDVDNGLTDACIFNSTSLCVQVRMLNRPKSAREPLLQKPPVRSASKWRLQIPRI